jgi:hypothetical protein
MSKPVQIAVVTASLAAGVVLGSILFRQRAEPAPARPAPVSKAPVAPDPASAELARALDRIAALESRLRDVESKVAAAPQERKKVTLEDLKELAKESGTTVFEGTVGDEDARPFGWRVPHQPSTVGSLLGLDAARRKTLEETYQSFVDRIRALEKEHSKVTVDGETTRIEISPFPIQGKALIDEWKGRLAGFLTADEQDKYKRLGLGLLPADIGQDERVVAIVEEKDGMATSTEQSGEKGFSGSFKGPKEMAFAPYRHLLKK